MSRTGGEKSRGEAREKEGREGGRKRRERVRKRRSGREGRREGGTYQRPPQIHYSAQSRKTEELQ